MSLPANDRLARWLNDLDATLDSAELLVSRGEEAFHSDPALALAFEALSNRVGDLSERLSTNDPKRFNAPIWSQAARNRDFVVHRYDRVDSQALWVTVSVSFPELRRILRAVMPEE